MSQEVFRRLGDNVGRLLAAGTSLATGDAALARDQEDLDRLARTLAGKVPAVARLADAVARVRAADPADAAGDVMALATATAQVCAAQVVLAVAEGETKHLAGRSAVGTPCGARRLYALHGALTRPGAGRERVIRSGIETGDLADLRLFDAVIAAVNDPHLGPMIAHGALPLFGDVAVDRLRGRLRLDGKASDARMLGVLVELEGDRAIDLIVAADRDGSVPVRSAAWEAAARHLPGHPGLEPALLESVERERAEIVRHAILRALAHYRSRVANEALARALAGCDKATIVKILGKGKRGSLSEQLESALRSVSRGVAKLVRRMLGR